MTNYVYILDVPEEKLGRYLYNLGTMEAKQIANARSSRNNPSISGPQKALMQILINQARALGWKLPTKWNGWEPDSLPNEILDLNTDDLEFLIQCQGKLMAKGAPTSECKTIKGEKITLPMQFYISKAGKRQWTLGDYALRYDWSKKQGKSYYILDEVGDKVFIKMKPWNDKEQGDCFPGYEVYDENKMKKNYSVWPVPFFPKDWAEASGNTKLLNNHFKGHTISIIEEEPVEAIAPSPETLLGENTEADADDLLADGDVSPDIGAEYQTPTGGTIEELPLNYKSKNRYDWQELAIERWVNNDFKGMVEASTGAGKTIFCLKAIDALMQVHGIDVDVSIVVPTEALQGQWYEEILERTPFEASQVARIGGGHKDKPAQITIYIINTARVEIPKRKHKNKHLLIVDEAHRATSASNSQIFGYKYNKNYQFSLGVSATFPEDEEAFGVLEDGLGKQLAVFRYAHALKKKTISKFKVVFLQTNFTQDEHDRYKELGKIAMAEKDPFWQKVRYGARAWVTWSAQQRLNCALQLIEKLYKQGKKIIIFHKRVEGIEALYNILRARNYEVGIYHSQGKRLNKTTRNNFLDAFRAGKIKVLLSAQALLEGLDVPDCDAAIAIAADKSSIKIVQSIGRVLRRKGDEDIKEFYSILVKQANSDKYLRAKFLNTLRDADGQLIVPAEIFDCDKIVGHLDAASLNDEAGFKFDNKGGAIVAQPEYPAWATAKRKKEVKSIQKKEMVTYAPPSIIEVEEEQISPPAGPPPEPIGPPVATSVETYQDLLESEEIVPASPLSAKKYVFYTDKEMQKHLIFLKEGQVLQAGTNSMASAIKFMEAYQQKRGLPLHMLENV